MGDNTNASKSKLLFKVKSLSNSVVSGFYHEIHGVALAAASVHSLIAATLKQSEYGANSRKICLITVNSLTPSDPEAVFIAKSQLRLLFQSHTSTVEITCTCWHFHHWPRRVQTNTDINTRPNPGRDTGTSGSDCRKRHFEMRLTPSHCGRRVLQPGVVAVLAIEVDDEERQIPKINKKSVNCYQQDSIHESSDL